MDLKLSFPKRTGSVFLRGDFEFLQIHKTTSKRSLPVLFVIYETIRIVGLRLTMAEMIQKFDIHANQITEWKKPLLSSVPNVFWQVR